MRYKLCKFCENRARDTPLRGVYIPHFGQIWVKISILGVLHPCRCTDGSEIWHGGGDLPLLHAKFHLHRCNVSPLRGEKPQNRSLSKLNTGRFALRAMLPVIRQVERHPFDSFFSNLCYASSGKVKPSWILMKQEIMGRSGISWNIWKSFTPRPIQITMPALNHSIFTDRKLFLMPN